MRCNYLFLIIVILIILANISYAHEEEIQENDYSTELISISFVLIVILSVYSIHQKKLSNNEKIILFLLIIIPAIISTFYISYSTISLNINSISKGPVHWHADFEIWSCGEKLELKDPESLFNRIGSPLFHEHNENRIHIEGVIKKLDDIKLHNFFDVIGGFLDHESISIPTNEKILNFKNNNLCNNQKAKLQVFLYKVKNPENTKKLIYEQKKLEDFKNYVLSPYQAVPPGDCIIIEFDHEKEKTSHICESYKLAIKKGDLTGS